MVSAGCMCHCGHCGLLAEVTSVSVAALPHNQHRLDLNTESFPSLVNDTQQFKLASLLPSVLLDLFLLIIPQTYQDTPMSPSKKPSILITGYVNLTYLQSNPRLTLLVARKAEREMHWHCSLRREVYEYSQLHALWNR